MQQLRNYTRWTDQGDRLSADILGCRYNIDARPSDGKVVLDGQEMVPDEARMIGVRLIEAAALADGDRAVRGRAAELVGRS